MPRRNKIKTARKLTKFKNLQSLQNPIGKSKPMKIRPLASFINKKD